MHTTLYLIRHAATPANLQTPAKLQGCRSNPDLAPLGVRQATATRDFLAIRPIDFIYTSPLRRSFRTAQILAEPHGLTPMTVNELTECDVGHWEGLSWEEIKAEERKKKGVKKDASILDEISTALPTLLRSAKLKAR